MAKILFSAIAGDARNKIGGNVFTKSRFGNIVRTKVSPVQPRTNAQSAVRSAFTAFSKAWAATLTSAERAGWNSLAAANPRKDVFGNTITLTGLQLYNSVNLALQAIKVARMDSPPLNLTVGAPQGIVVVSAVGPPITLTVDGTVEPGADDVPVVYAVGPLNAGRTFVGSKFKQLEIFTAGTAGPWNIANAYAAKYGTLVAGQVVNVAVKYISNSTGAISALSTGSVVIA